MLNKNDPLISAVQKVMQTNQAEREAVKSVNEKFGVTDRKALPYSRQSEWDNAYKQIISEGSDPYAENEGSGAVTSTAPKPVPKPKPKAQDPYGENEGSGSVTTVKEEEELDEVAPPGAKYERMVKHIKSKLSKNGLTSKEKAIAYATAWKAKNNSVNEQDVSEEIGKAIKPKGKYNPFLGPQNAPVARPALPGSGESGPQNFAPGAAAAAKRANMSGGGTMGSSSGPAFERSGRGSSPALPNKAGPGPSFETKGRGSTPSLPKPVTDNKNGAGKMTNPTQRPYDPNNQGQGQVTTAKDFAFTAKERAGNITKERMAQFYKDKGLKSSGNMKQDLRTTLNAARNLKLGKTQSTELQRANQSRLQSQNAVTQAQAQKAAPAPTANKPVVPTGNPNMAGNNNRPVVPTGNPNIAGDNKPEVTRATASRDASQMAVDRLKAQRDSNALAKSGPLGSGSVSVSPKPNPNLPNNRFGGPK